MPATSLLGRRRRAGRQLALRLVVRDGATGRDEPARGGLDVLGSDLGGGLRPELAADLLDLAARGLERGERLAVGDALLLLEPRARLSRFDPVAARSASAASSSASSAARSSSIRRRWSATFASSSSTFAPAAPSSIARALDDRASMPMRVATASAPELPGDAEVQLERRLEPLEVEADRRVREPRVGAGRRAP